MLRGICRTYADTISQIMTGLVLAFVLVVAACSGPTSVFDARACPREKVYTAEEQRKIADALPQAPPIIQGVVVDYGKDRDKMRACRRAG